MAFEAFAFGYVVDRERSRCGCGALTQSAFHGSPAAAQKRGQLINSIKMGPLCPIVAYLQEIKVHHILINARDDKGDSYKRIMELIEVNIFQKYVEDIVS